MEGGVGDLPYVHQGLRLFVPHDGLGLLVGGQLESPGSIPGRLLLAGGHGRRHRPPGTLWRYARTGVAACSLSWRSPLWRYAYS